MKNIEKNDEYILTKAKDIADGALSVMRGEKDSAKIKPLEEALESNVFIGGYITKLADENTVEDVCREYDRADRDEQVLKLSRAIKNRKLVTRRRILISALSVASAVIAISFFVYHNNKMSQLGDSDGLVVTVVEPMVSVPTIISEGGERVEVDRGDDTVRIVDYDFSKASRVSDETICNTFVVPRQFVCDVELSDGTIVKMNAGSRLKYPKNFEGSAREVELEGEAYFVVKKSDIPFRVKVKDITVSVFGTEFNINQTSLSIQTLLVSGSVGVVRDGKELILTPNDLYDLNAKSGDVTLSKVNPNNYLSWMGSSFNYEEITLQHLLERLSGWYGVPFKLKRKSMGSMKVDIQIDKYERIEDVLHILEQTIGIRAIKQKDGCYTVH